MDKIVVYYYDSAKMEKGTQLVCPLAEISPSLQGKLP